MMDKISGKSREMAPSPSSQASDVVEHKFDKLLIDKSVGIFVIEPLSTFFESPFSDFFRCRELFEQLARVSRQDVRMSEWGRNVMRLDLFEFGVVVSARRSSGLSRMIRAAAGARCCCFDFPEV